MIPVLSIRERLLELLRFGEVTGPRGTHTIFPLQALAHGTCVTVNGVRSGPAGNFRCTSRGDIRLSATRQE
ncbi:unnamed protein product [Haemonchus placei]|uniref:Uncharacterized protein n=1 Tax=Haemonchus placei TaxID=6290 RepID=A0A3P7WU44_HAEPC|nr:unnamed protein product [Haemonchus placei]